MYMWEELLAQFQRSLFTTMLKILPSENWSPRGKTTLQRFFSLFISVIVPTFQLWTVIILKSPTWTKLSILGVIKGECLLKVPLWSKFRIAFSFHFWKLEVRNTYHAKFNRKILTGIMIISTLFFVFGRPPLLNSKMAECGKKSWH